MLPMEKFRWLWLYILVIYFNIRCVTSDWPSSKSSKVQILGIFANQLNQTQFTIQSIHARAMFQAAIILSHQYNITIGGEFIDWRLVQSTGDPMNTLGSTCQEISNSKIAGIVGPTFSREAHVIAPFAGKLNIPVISYASTDPALSYRKTYPTFYRTVSSDNEAAFAIIKLFLKYNWKSCIIIYQNDAFGSGGTQAINNKFSEYNLTVTEMIMFDVVTRSIRGDLKTLLNSSPTRIVILWAESTYTSLILQTACNNDLLGPHFTWILSSNIPLNTFNRTWHTKLNGILTIEPVVGNVVNAPINKTLLNAAYNIWQQYEPESFPGSDNINSYALFSFDATWSLIESLQKLCSTYNNHSSSCISFVNTSFCFKRRFINSNLLLNIINNNSFLGVSGPVEFNINVTDRMNGIYYVVKNVQNFSENLNYVPVLVWSNSGDWNPYKQTNTIVWPGQSLVPPTGYATTSGITLRIAIIEAHPFTMTKEVKDEYGQIRTKTIGFVPDLIEYLQRKMGFIPIITPLPSNHTYNGLIDKIENNLYDMAIGDITILASRRARAGFSSSIFDNSLRVLIRDTDSNKIDLWSFLKPFSTWTWITIFCLLIWAALLICTFEQKRNKAFKKDKSARQKRSSKKSICSRIGMGIWYSIGTMIGYGVDFHVKTAPGRFLVVGIYILSVVLIATYTANLTSNITLSKSRGIISGIDDIKNGKLPYSRIGILTDSSIEDYYLREISGGSRNFYPLKSKEEMYDKLLNNIIDASIMDSGVLEYMTNGVYCNLTLTGTAFDRSTFGIVFPKRWLYEQILDVNILSLREEGVFDNLKKKWFESNYCPHSSDTTNELSLQQVSGIVLTFVVISILSILLFIWLKFKIKANIVKLAKDIYSALHNSIEVPDNNSVVEPNINAPQYDPSISNLYF